MDTRNIEAKLAEKYGYKPLDKELSKKYREFYEDNIPRFLNLEGGGALRTTRGTTICKSYDRIVIGDYGAFIEFTNPDYEFLCEKGQEFRINDPKYQNKVKYNWLTVPDCSGIKIYQQKKGVTYADYKAGKYYVSVHEVMHG